jgi:Ca2+-dependent lipid-binding protein
MFKRECWQNRLLHRFSCSYLRIKTQGSLTWLFSTQVQKKTLSPKWNETHTVVVHRNHTKDLVFIVELWDDDFLKDDFIGTAKLTFYAGSVDAKFEFNGDIDLVDKKGLNREATVTIGVNATPAPAGISRSSKHNISL